MKYEHGGREGRTLLEVGWLFALQETGSGTVTLMRDRGFVHPHGSVAVLALEGPVCAVRQLKLKERMRKMESWEEKTVGRD